MPKGKKNITPAEYLANKDAPIVSNWLHFWNRQDGALVTSNIANLNARTGSNRIDIIGANFESIEWDENLLAHGYRYVGNTFDNDYEFKTEVYRALKSKLQAPAVDVYNYP